MPTFTIPGSTATASAATATAAAASTKKPSNRRKKPVTPEPEPEPESTTVSETLIVIDTIPEPDPESPVSEPTFPDIVILKQTEHNYIIKHNHYPTLSSSTSDGASMSASASAEWLARHRPQAWGIWPQALPPAPMHRARPRSYHAPPMCACALVAFNAAGGNIEARSKNFFDGVGSIYL